MRPVLLRATVLCLLTLCGCLSVGEVVTTEHRIDSAGAAETLSAYLEMNAGELRVFGEACAIMDGTFKTNVREWTSTVDYEEHGLVGILRVAQPDEAGIPLGEVENSWSVGLTNDLPLDLKVDLGIGEARLDLTDVDLHRAHIDLGVGELRVNLARPWSSDVRVSIDLGIGELRLDLPRSVGVKVVVDNGIGDVSVGKGLHRQGESIVNEIHGSHEVTLTIHVDLGIGSVVLRVRDDEENGSFALLTPSAPQLAAGR